MINNWDLFSRLDSDTGNICFSLLIDGTEQDARLIAKKLKGYAGTPVPAEPPFVYSFPLPSNLDEITQDKIRTAAREGVEKTNKVNQFVPGGELGDPLFNNPETQRTNSFPSFTSLTPTTNATDQTESSEKKTSIDLSMGESLSIEESTQSPMRVISLDETDEKLSVGETPSSPVKEDTTIENILEEEHLEVDEEKEQTSYIPATELGSFVRPKITPPPAPTPEQTAAALAAPVPPGDSIATEDLAEKTNPSYIPATDFHSFVQKPLPPTEDLPEIKTTETDDASTRGNEEVPPVAPANDQPENPEEKEEKTPLPQGNLEIPDFTFTQSETPAAQPETETSVASDTAVTPEEKKPAQEDVPFNDHDMLIKDMEGTMLDNMPIEDIFAAETKLDMFVDVENPIKTEQNQQQREEKLVAATEGNSPSDSSFDIFEQKLKEQTSIIDLNDIDAFLSKMPKPTEPEPTAEKEDLQIHVETVKAEEETPQEIPVQTEPEEPVIQNSTEEAKTEETTLPTSEETPTKEEEKSSEETVSAPAAEETAVETRTAEHTFRLPSKHADVQEDLPEIVVLRRENMPEETEINELAQLDALSVDAEIHAETPVTEAVEKEDKATTEEPVTTSQQIEDKQPETPISVKEVKRDAEPAKDSAVKKQGINTSLQKPLPTKTAAPIKPLADGKENNPAAAPISLPRKNRMEENKQKPILKIKPKIPAAPSAPTAPGTPQPPTPSTKQPTVPHLRPTVAPGATPILKKPVPANPEPPTNEAEGADAPAEKTRTIDHSIQIPLSELKKHSWPLEVPLNPTYTLSNMVMSVNRFAHATAISVIEAPGKLYNPLVFHGETGTGKTHFLNAMAYAFSQKFGQTNIFMTNGVRLSRGIQRYIMEGNIEKFDKFISTVQVLLIDDIHLLAINEQNRAYISKLLNTFLKEQKQIVITSKYPPESLEKLEELIKFKLDSGWISELKQASGSTYVKIVKKMLLDNNVDLNDTQITEFFVSKQMTLGTVIRSIRRLKVLENLIPPTVDINQRSQAAILEKLLASKGEDEKSWVSVTDPTTITSIAPQGKGEWGKIGFFYPAGHSNKMNWMVYALQERAKELGLEGGFEIVVRSSYATENIISSAFKIANLCDNKKLKGAVILGPEPDTCDPSVKENFYDILSHMLEIMLIRCGIINFETLRHPSTYVKLISELMR